MKLISTLAVLFASFTGSYGWFLDKSCASTYKNLVVDGMNNAFDLAQAGSDTFSITPSGNGAKWQAQKDIISYLLAETLTAGDIDPKSQNWGIAKGVFTSVLKYNKNNRPQTLPSNPATLGTDSVIVFCDFGRFKEDRDCNNNKRPGKACDTSIGVVIDMGPLYQACKDPKGNIPISAYTDNYSTAGVNRAALIQLCPGWLNVQQSLKVKSLKDQGSKNSLARSMLKMKSLMNKPSGSNDPPETSEFDTPMDLAKSLDTTMLHEMTHAIPGAGLVDAAGDVSYGWTNCVAMSKAGIGIKNSDNYALFGLASRMISPNNGAPAQRPMQDGSIQVLPVAAKAGSKRHLFDRAANLTFTRGQNSSSSISHRNASSGFSSLSISYSSRSSSPSSSDKVSVNSLATSSESSFSHSVSKNETVIATGPSLKSPSSRPFSGSSTSSSQSSFSTTGPSIPTTLVSRGSTQILTFPPSSITSPPSTSTTEPVLILNWRTVTPTTTSGVSKATHDSHGWPIIPSLHCWFCPPHVGTDIGFVIPGITGPGIILPPPPGVAPPPGFSSDMPTITLDSAGDPTYSSTEPESSSSSSSSSRSSSSCLTQTFSACDTSYSVFTASGESTESTSTFTLSCSSVTGCSVSSLTGSSTTDTAEITATPVIASEPAFTDWYYAQQSILSVLMADDTDPYITWSSDEATATGSAIQSAMASSSASQGASRSGPPTANSTATSIASSTGSTSSLQFTSPTVTLSSAPKSTSKTKTTVPPITSCTLASVAAFSSAYPLYTIDIPATIECTCNDGWMAGIGTSVGSDQSTTYTCQVTGSQIAVSTAPPTTTSKTAVLPPAPYQTGTCDLHILEASQDSRSPLYIFLNITDGGGNMLAIQSTKISWGDTAVVKSVDSKLPYDIDIDFLISTTVPSKPKMIKGRMIGPGAAAPAPATWEKWNLTLTAGHTTWDSTENDETQLPYCSVGGWDNGNFWDWAASLLSLGVDSSIPVS
ncbi:hypothetical protein LARI1_G001711 [Lachnellula arida]|uniref:Lysine-specific metallo-endopeptidase domain-containing protein n=1 Tax=Lachnellula arida TaxID=1316785 RepID=A0A8T9BLN9_9HELO|nr:hypothetical protein LARI1_G001711 [Lachnellula arida]